MGRSAHPQKTYDFVEVVAAFACFAAATPYEPLLELIKLQGGGNIQSGSPEAGDSRAFLLVFAFAFAKLLLPPVSVLESAVAMTQ